MLCYCFFYFWFHFPTSGIVYYFLLIDQLLFYKMNLSLSQLFIANRLMLSRNFHRIIRLLYQSVQADQ